MTYPGVRFKRDCSKGEIEERTLGGKDPWEPADLGAVRMAVQREQGHRTFWGTSTTWLAPAGSRERWPGDGGPVVRNRAVRLQRWEAVAQEEGAEWEALPGVREAQVSRGE